MCIKLEEFSKNYLKKFIIVLSTFFVLFLFGGNNINVYATEISTINQDNIDYITRYSNVKIIGYLNHDYNYYLTIPGYKTVPDIPLISYAGAAGYDGRISLCEKLGSSSSDITVHVFNGTSFISSPKNNKTYNDIIYNNLDKFQVFEEFKNAKFYNMNELILDFAEFNSFSGEFSEFSIILSDSNTMYINYNVSANQDISFIRLYYFTEDNSIYNFSVEDNPVTYVDPNGIKTGYYFLRAFNSEGDYFDSSHFNVYNYSGYITASYSYSDKLYFNVDTSKLNWPPLKYEIYKDNFKLIESENYNTIVIDKIEYGTYTIYALGEEVESGAPLSVYCNINVTALSNSGVAGNSGGGTSWGDSDPHINTSEFPTLPPNANILDYIVYLFDIVKWLINSLVNSIKYVLSGIGEVGNLFGNVFNSLPAPIPQLFVCGLIILVLSAFLYRR